MMTSARPALRATLGRVAVAGAATLASMTAGAPSAQAAAEDLAPESTEPLTSAGTVDPAPALASESAELPTGSETSKQEFPAERPAPADDADAQVQDPMVEAAPVQEGPVDAAPSEEAPSEPTVEEPASDEEAPGTTAADDEVYGSQTYRVSFSLDPDAYYPDEDRHVGAEAYYFDGDQHVGGMYCVATLTKSAAGTKTGCTSGDENGVTEFEVPPGLRAEIGWQSREGYQRRVLEPCLVDECAADPIEVDFVVEGDAPYAVSSLVEARPGEPVAYDVLTRDSVGDPSTTVEIVGAPEHGVATVTTDGRQRIVYTAAEDFSGQDELTYTLTNSNGTSTGTLAYDVAADKVTPEFGTRKYRIGTQISSGAFVPQDPTTIGSTFTIKTFPQGGGDPVITTCTTTDPPEPTLPPDVLPPAAPAQGPTEFSSCAGDGDSPLPGLEPIFRFYRAAPGDRVEITQSSAPDGLVADPKTVVVEPCNLNLNESCDDVNATFNATGSILPETEPDTATADEGGEPIDIDVLANDDSEDPNTTLSVTPLPAGQGTIEVVGEGAPAQPPVDEEEQASPDEPVGVLAVPSAGSLALRYTPAANFSGTIPVQYTVTNSNGSTTETLTITVRPGAVDPAPDPDPVDPTPPTDPVDPTPPSDPSDPEVEPVSEEPADVTFGQGKVAAKAGASNAALPDAGGPAPSLLGLGALLAAAGSVVGARSRRRPVVTRER